MSPVKPGEVEDMDKADVELQAPAERKGGPAQKAAPAAVARSMTVPGKFKNATPFKRFLGGPYFDVIPPQYERVTAERAKADSLGPPAEGSKAADAEPTEDYLAKLKRIVMNPVDVDEVYGLTYEELVPLPFNVPKWHAYLVDILLGVYLVAQATIVMFIAINVENEERSWKSGSAYTRSWLPMVKALVIVYPLVTLIMLVTLTVEYAIRKFMYFRLLSMRILVDWTNINPLKTVFFWYFIFTWVVMNCWAIYGVAKYYNQYGNPGVDPVSFGTFVIVNLQTIQLLIYYTKLLSSENRLVSLNQIFERAPVEAQRLLEFTYVIEEQDLIDECYAFAVTSERAFWSRILNILTCCMAAKGWQEEGTKIRFDIERLKIRAPNYQEVERNIRELREEVAEEAAAAKGPLAPDQVAVTVDGGANASPAAAIIELGPDGRPLPRVLPQPVLSCCGWSLTRWGFQNMYGSLHSMHVSVMMHFHSWPFRPDTMYFRMLTLVQLLGILAVGAIVVLGWVVSTRESTCGKSAKTCNTCLAVHERYFASAEPVCQVMERAIAGIVASANGTWVNEGVQQERYCNWACFGNFTASNATCPAT